MSTPVIIDIVTVAVLGGLIVFCMMRGLIKAVLGVAVLLISLWGAAQISELLMEPVSDFVAARMEERIQQRLDAFKESAVESAKQAASEAVKEAVSGAVKNAASETGVDPSSNQFDLSSIRIPDLPDLFKQIGMDGEESTGWQKRLEETMSKMTGGIMGTAGLKLRDVIRETIQPLVRGILYGVSFFVLSFVLKLLVKPLSAVAHLPGIAQFNRAGGAVLGILEATIVLIAATWLLGRMGMTFDRPPLSETVVLRILAGIPLIRSFL